MAPRNGANFASGSGRGHEQCICMHIQARAHSDIDARPHMRRRALSSYAGSTGDIPTHEEGAQGSRRGLPGAVQEFCRQSLLKATVRLVPQAKMSSMRQHVKQHSQAWEQQKKGLSTSHIQQQQHSHPFIWLSEFHMVPCLSSTCTHLQRRPKSAMQSISWARA